MSDAVGRAILLQVVLIFVNAIFACAEIAFISINEARLEKRVQQGEKNAIRLKKMISQPSRFLSVIQTGITLAGFMGSAFASNNFSDGIVEFLMEKQVNLPEDTLYALTVIVITLIIAYFTLVFGELVPKRLAMKQPEKIALAIVTPIYWISKLFSPIVWCLTRSTNLILRLLRINPNEADDPMSREDFWLLIDKGNEEGVIGNQEKKILQKVFAFDDLTVGEFATRRPAMVWLRMQDDLKTWEKTLIRDRHTVYPVCEETPNQVVGLLDARSFFKLREWTKEEMLKKAVKPPFFVLENSKADTLFQQMRQNRRYFAVVLDEYGATAGIVTMKDLIDQLIGKIYPEDMENWETKIQPIAENRWQIGGMVRLEEVEETLQITLPTENYRIFSGYVLGLYGSVPEDGSQFEMETDTLKIQVKSMKEHKVEWAEVERKESIKAPLEK